MYAQSPAASDSHAGAPIARTTPVRAPLRIDGSLDEPAWANAIPVTGFLQRDPDEGAAVSQPTEVLDGDLTVAFGGPAQTLLRLALRDQGGGTGLELSDSIVGHVGDGMPTTLDQGWRALFEVGFKQYVEAKQMA
jgi:hypothetical protein